MSTSEIIAQLPHLTPDERAQIQAKLDELAATAWQDRGELSDADREALETSLKDYERSPDVGSSWNEIKARIQSKLRS